MRERVFAVVMILGLGLALVIVGSVGWVGVASGGHVSSPAAARGAAVAIVFGAQLEQGRPMTVLRHRLDATVLLYRSGKVATILVSGDAGGGSGNETAAMTRHLLDAGVPAASIRVDGLGLDTHATCRRAVDLFGVRQALLVTQRFHLPRAVALCRAAGIDAHGVDAGCAGCSRPRYAWNTVRDWLAAPKAVFEVFSDLVVGTLG